MRPQRARRPPSRFGDYAHVGEAEDADDGDMAAPAKRIRRAGEARDEDADDGDIAARAKRVRRKAPVRRSGGDAGDDEDDDELMPDDEDDDELMPDAECGPLVGPSWQRLPSLVLDGIAQYLQPWEVFELAQVCTWWARSIGWASFLRRLYAAEAPPVPPKYKRGSKRRRDGDTQAVAVGLAQVKATLARYCLGCSKETKSLFWAVPGARVCRVCRDKARMQGYVYMHVNHLMSLYGHAAGEGTLTQGEAMAQYRLTRNDLYAVPHAVYQIRGGWYAKVAYLYTKLDLLRAALRRHGKAPEFVLQDHFRLQRLRRLRRLCDKAAWAAGLPESCNEGIVAELCDAMAADDDIDDNDDEAVGALALKLMAPRIAAFETIRAALGKSNIDCNLGKYAQVREFVVKKDAGDSEALAAATLEVRRAALADVDGGFDWESFAPGKLFIEQGDGTFDAVVGALEEFRKALLEELCEQARAAGFNDTALQEIRTNRKIVGHLYRTGSIPQAISEGCGAFLAIAQKQIGVRVHDARLPKLTTLKCFLAKASAFEERAQKLRAAFVEGIGETELTEAMCSKLLAGLDADGAFHKSATMPTLIKFVARSVFELIAEEGGLGTDAEFDDVSRTRTQVLTAIRAPGSQVQTPMELVSHLREVVQDIKDARAKREEERLERERRRAEARARMERRRAEESAHKATINATMGKLKQEQEPVKIDDLGELIDAVAHVVEESCEDSFVAIAKDESIGDHDRCRYVLFVALMVQKNCHIPWIFKPDYLVVAGRPFRSWIQEVLLVDRDRPVVPAGFVARISSLYSANFVSEFGRRRWSHNLYFA